MKCIGHYLFPFRKPKKGPWFGAFQIPWPKRSHQGNSRSILHLVPKVYDTTPTTIIRPITAKHKETNPWDRLEESKLYTGTFQRSKRTRANALTTHSRSTLPSTCQYFFCWISFAASSTYTSSPASSSWFASSPLRPRCCWRLLPSPSPMPPWSTRCVIIVPCGTVFYCFLRYYSST